MYIVKDNSSHLGRRIPTWCKVVGRFLGPSRDSSLWLSALKTGPQSPIWGGGGPLQIGISEHFNDDVDFGWIWWRGVEGQRYNRVKARLCWWEDLVRRKANALQSEVWLRHRLCRFFQALMVEYQQFLELPLSINLRWGVLAIHLERK